MEMSANNTGTVKEIKGRFKKGQSGNPSGRPKQDPEVKAIFKAATTDAAEKLVGFMSHKDPKIAMWAITELLNRVYGKPTQAQNVQLDVAGFLDVRAQIRTVLMEKANDQRRITGDNNS